MKWFLRDQLTPLGPFSEEQVRERLVRGDLDPSDLIWREGDKDWLPAFQWPEFRALSMPAFQEASMVPEDSEIWVVLRTREEGQQTEGPMSLAQIREHLIAGRYTFSDLLWKRGMSGWAKLGSRPEFQNVRITSPDPESPYQP